eukprot:403362974
MEMSFKIEVTESPLKLYFIKECYEDLLNVEDEVNIFFEQCSHLSDDAALESLTLICRLLNEDTVLAKIRQDNEVTYESQSLRNESFVEYRSQSNSLINSKYQSPGSQAINGSNTKQGKISPSKEGPRIDDKTLDQYFVQMEDDQPPQSNDHRMKQKSMYQKDDQKQLRLIEETKQEENEFLQRHHSSSNINLVIEHELKSGLEYEIKKKLEEIEYYYGEYRIDEAGQYLKDLRQYIDENINDDNREKVELLVKELIDENQHILKLQRDKIELDFIVEQLNDTDGFQTVSQDRKKGLMMQIKREEGQRNVTFRFEAKKQKIHLFNLLCLINETDLYDLWFPQCKKSYTLKKLGKAAKVAYIEFFFPFPFTNREGLMYGFGANRVKSHGSLVIIAKSYGQIDDPYLKELIGELDFSKRKNGLVEMEVLTYGFEIVPVSPTEIDMRAVMKFNPNMDNIPESLINWGTKQFLDFMIQKMIKFSKGMKGTKYEQRLKSSENAEFYLWIQGYIRDFYNEKGWPYENTAF